MSVKRYGARTISGSARYGVLLYAYHYDTPKVDGKVTETWKIWRNRHRTIILETLL